MNPKYPEILEREFRKAANLPDDAQVSVKFTDDETIVVTVNGAKWTMVIGSDDDYFWFQLENSDQQVRFDFPQDWLDLEENGPWD